MKIAIEDEGGLRDELLLELDRAQDAAITMREVARKYRLARADLGAKVFQHPKIVDYKLALQEFDEHDLFLARQHFHDILNIYILLHDLFRNIVS
ncbi:hypothetical protein CPB83DRAFT_855543 [Crepidotus variabilis]|uniref:Proteasome activator PA28 C-terminal domain-containing protein n=1 Tax=Crepidotus variabilis TaxID=179855 RepID=A0A9P6EE11_9AGAR|nr:hypothetical protein CPB83DRAFT_855543 [Crepidotus variabilis]